MKTLEPFEVKRAYALYQKILAPAEPLLDGAKQLLIVPDGALESLPFGVLVTQPPKADPKDLADHRDVAWFARDHAITVLPSVGSLRALREFASGAHAGAPFVGIGNPVLVGKPEGRRPSSPAYSAARSPTSPRCAPWRRYPKLLTNCGRSPRRSAPANRTFISPIAPPSRCCAKPGLNVIASSSLRRTG